MLHLKKYVCTGPRKNLWLVLAVAAITVLFVGGAFYFWQESVEPAAPVAPGSPVPVPTPTPLPAPPASDPVDPLSSFSLQGSQIYEAKSDGTRRLLFKNVRNVTAVRRGPDGNTLHFKTMPSPASSYINSYFCADLASSPEPIPNGYSNPPPQQPPWDFERIGWAYTIKSCPGGYLKNAPLFAYMEDPGENVGPLRLVIEELGTGGKVHKINVDRTQFGRYLDDQHFITKFEDTTTTYFYPKENSYRVNEKIVISFGGAALMANLKNDKFLGLELLVNPPYNIIDNSYYFEKKEQMPYTVVHAGWEGCPWLAALLDFSGSRFNTYRLTDFEQPCFYLYKTPVVEWQKDKLVLNLFKEKDLEQYITPAEKEAILKHPANDFNGSQYEKQVESIETRLKALGNYSEVQCVDNQAYGPTGCFAVVPGDRYQISPGKTLEKL